MPTGSNIPVILNAAERAAAERERRVAQQRIDVAEAAKIKFAEESKAGILGGITGLSKGITEFTKSLQTGKNLKSTTATAKQALEQSKQVTGQLNPQLQTIESNISSAVKALAGINIPAPIYGLTGTTDTTSTGANASQSAYDLLFEQFNQYGLGALVEPLKSFIQEGISPAEFTIRLRNTDAYKKRFAANAIRIQKGLRALSEAEYIGLEDQYQNIMRNYGLPTSYYERGDLGRQEGFEKFIAGDVSPAELEDRISTAQNRITYANPEVGIALKTFYPDITNGDLIAYTLDPDKALAQIKRRITAAEIGASAVQLGLATNVTDAEYLARYGVTKEQAQQGYRAVAETLPRASFLGDIYGEQGLGAYTQATAEQEVFNVPGAAEAAAKRRKLTQLEQAAFSGSAGVAGGALARDRAGAF